MSPALRAIVENILKATPRRRIDAQTQSREGDETTGSTNRSTQPKRRKQWWRDYF